jgi:uncharacterized protein (TIGR02145 family)
MKKVLAWLFLFLIHLDLAGQNINTTLGNISNVCVGDTVLVPVSITMGSGISTSTISMAIDYDTTKLRCISSVSSLNSNIAVGFLSNCGLFSNLTPGIGIFSPTTRRQFRAAWFALSPVAFNGLMFNLRFIVRSSFGGATPISWDVRTAGNCEYADELADVIPNCTFVNGSVSMGATSSVLITAQPSGITNLTAGSNTVFTVSASGTPSPTYQWQELTIGGNWSNLSNGGVYGGVTTASLTITGATISMNGNQYRVVVSNGCGGASISSVLNLSVIQGFNIGQVNICLGDTVMVPLTHSPLSGVANASLRLTYNPDSLTYLGFQSLNSAFSGMTIVGGSGSILMDWNTSSNQIIPMGNLVQLRFLVNGSSNLTWDTTQFPCEVSDLNFNVVPLTYGSGSIVQNTKKLTWNRTICQGQAIVLGTQSYSSSGTFQGRLFGFGGACDTLITLNLSVIPRQVSLPPVTTCANQPYAFNGLLLSASGTYYDTLTNSLGCDSILQLNLTALPSYNQIQNIVICSGTTYLFGGQNLSSSGTYSHTYSTIGGCDSIVQLNLSVAGTVTISSANNLNGFCPGGSLRIGLANPIPNSTYQWIKDSSVINSASADTLLVAQTGVYQLIVHVTPTCSVVSNILSISVLNCNQISGNLKYDNNSQTALVGVPVHLRTLLGNIVSSDTTDSLGSYDMRGYNNGTYVLDAQVNYSPGGINSTDALQVTRYFTSLTTFTSLRIKAGDVNGNNISNSADALLINRRITGLLPAFSVGAFVNNLPSVNATGNPIVGNLRVLSAGDVNGTYNPLPSAPTIVLDTVYGNGNVGTAVVRFTNPGSGVFERGIVWSSSPNPTVTSSKSVAGKGGFGFTHSFGTIDPNNIQYARAYARTSAGVFYSPERSFTSVPWVRCPGTPSVTDIDGNLYQTVQIGNQCWTQSNLKVSKFRDGGNIPNITGEIQWEQTHTSSMGGWCNYNNDSSNGVTYGKLYNWYAVSDSRGLCPTGWHVPSDEEWTILTTYLGGTSVAGGEMKSTTGWIFGGNGTNTSGFSALPGGIRSGGSGLFTTLGNHGDWWSSTSPCWNCHPWVYRLENYSAAVTRYGDTHRSGFSIRCLKDVVPTVSTTAVSVINTTSATTGGDVTQDGGAPVTMRGVVYGTSSSPLTSGSITNDGSGTGVYTSTLVGLTPSTTYYVRAYATNPVGTAYGNEVTFTTQAIPAFTCGTSTVSDVDGNSYNSVQIGTQCWTQSNLKVSKYRNGDSIPTVYNDLDWASLTYGAFCILENNPIYNGVYGKLYNHFAVMDVRGICPTGWHVPSDFEWKILIRHLDASADTMCNVNYGQACVPSTMAGGMLRNVAVSGNLGVSGWGQPNAGATNSSGFDALPGGWRHNTNGAFIGTTDMAYWWSYKLINAPSILLMSNTASIYISQNEDYILKTNGNYVRCLKD